MKKTVYIFGNPDIEEDSLPLRLLPLLKERMPEYDFLALDPNENWDLPEKLIIIDTIEGIEKVTTFTSLDDFARTPALTMHDFDLGMKLKWLSKIKKLPPFKIVGVPIGANEEEVLEGIIKILRIH